MHNSNRRHFVASVLVPVCAHRILLHAVLCILVTLVGCHGDSQEATSDNNVLVVHDPANIEAGTDHLRYMVLNQEGDFVYLQPEYQAGEQNLITVPSDAGFVVVQERDESNEVLDEDVLLISSQGEDYMATMSSDHRYWMTGNPRVQSSSIAEITLPGAHDAGMGEVSSCSDYGNAKTTQTQKKSFKEMMKSGVRYFDVRPILGAPSSPAMHLGHFQWVGEDLNLGIHTFSLRNEGCVGYSMDAMLEDVREFVSDKNSHEIVILKMSHFMDFNKYDNDKSHFDEADLNQLEAKINAKLSEYLVRGNTDFRNTPISTLTEHGPKVIVTFEASGYDGSNGIYSEKYLNLYDRYSDKNDVDKMKDDQFAKMSEYGRPMDRPVNPYRTSVDRNGKCYGQCKEWLQFEEKVRNDKLTRSYFVLSWTLTQSENQTIGCSLPLNIGKLFGYNCLPLQDLAVKADKKIVQVISQSKKTRRYPNVIYTDNTDAGITNATIAINSIEHNW